MEGRKEGPARIGSRSLASKTHEQMKVKKRKRLRVIKGDYFYTTAEDAADIKKITGSLFINFAEDAIMPALTDVLGHVYIRAKNASLPALTNVGSISIWEEGAYLPVLTNVDDAITIRASGMSLPMLTVVGSFLYIYAENVNLPALTVVVRYLYVLAENANMPALTSVGSLDIDKEGANLPMLTNVDGNLSIRAKDTIIPALTRVKSIHVRAENVSLPMLADIEEALSVRAGRASMPALTSVGSLRIPAGGASIPATIAKRTSPSTAKRKHFEAILSCGYLFADGIFAKIHGTSKKVDDFDVYRITICGESKRSFAVVRRSDLICSHGKTLKKAFEDLIYKVSDRDSSKYKNWTLDTKITKAEAIASYRVITGACEEGCRNFIESIGGGKDQYTVAEVIEETAGMWGNDEYVQFFMLNAAK